MEGGGGGGGGVTVGVVQVMERCVCRRAKRSAFSSIFPLTGILPSKWILLVPYAITYFVDVDALPCKIIPLHQPFHNP